MQLGYMAEQIKQSVPISEAIEYYTGERFVKNKMCCPLHSEKTASFTVYPDTNSFYCFGCCESGDIIRFIQKLFNVDFREAVKRLDCDFNLGLTNQPTFSQYRQRQRELNRSKASQKIKNEQKEAADKQYWEALDKVLEYENIIKRHCPGGLDAEPAPEFINALQNIEYARHLLDCAENERRRISEQ